VGVVEVLATALIVSALVVAAWAAVLVVVGRPVVIDKWHGLVLFGGAALLELGLLAQAVVGFVNLAGTERQVDGLTFGGYLVGILLVLPLAGFWSLAERTRWGPAVMVAGCVAVSVLIVRLGQIWDGHA
jgi:hypothetical protein